MKNGAIIIDASKGNLFFKDESNKHFYRLRRRSRRKEMVEEKNKLGEKDLLS